MKISDNQITSFIKKPCSDVKAFLVYGPDEGAVLEIFNNVSKAIVEDLNNPFNVVNITEDNLTQNPSILFDEAASMSLMGGRRLIRVREGTEPLTDAVDFFLKNYSGDSFVIIAAGNLAKSSKLRKLAETAENMLVFAAYPDNPEKLNDIIMEDIKAAGKKADFDTVVWLGQNLGADRGLTRSEIQKLITYAGDSDVITLEMATSVIGDGAAVSIDDLVFALAEGDFNKMDKALQRIFREDDNAAVAIVRSCINHFVRLHKTIAKISSGMSAF